MIKTSGGFIYRVLDETTIEVLSTNKVDWYKLDYLKRTCECLSFRFRQRCKHWDWFGSVANEINKPNETSLEIIKKFSPNGELDSTEITDKIGSAEFDKLISNCSIIKIKNKIYIV